MTPQSQKIMNEVLGLSPVDRAELVEHIMASFGSPDREEIDKAWAQEVEDRLDAYDRGQIGARAVADVFKDLDNQA